MARMVSIKHCSIFPIRPLYRTFNFEEKPSELLALEIMKIFLWTNLLA
jgi:hypothetical protein